MERKVKKGKLLTSLVHYGDRYHVKFDMWIEQWIPQVASVIHIGNKDSERLPAVFLHPSKKLQINVNNSTKYLHLNMQTRRWYSIDVTKALAGRNVSRKSLD